MGRYIEPSEAVASILVFPIYERAPAIGNYQFIYQMNTEYCSEIMRNIYDWQWTTSKIIFIVLKWQLCKNIILYWSTHVLRTVITKDDKEESVKNKLKKKHFVVFMLSHQRTEKLLFKNFIAQSSKYYFSLSYHILTFSSWNGCDRTGHCRYSKYMYNNSYEFIIFSFF